MARIIDCRVGTSYSVRTTATSLDLLATMSTGTSRRWSAPTTTSGSGCEPTRGMPRKRAPAQDGVLEVVRW